MHAGLSNETSGPGNGASAYCCLEHAALDGLTVPVVVHDDERILYLNGSARAFLDIESAHPDVRLDELVAPDAAEGSAERRRLSLKTGLGLGPVSVQVARPDGGTYSVVARGTRICYGEDHRHALVQVVCSVDGAQLYEPNGYDAVVSATCPDEVAPCIHAAAFEALPIPSSVLSAEAVVRFNRAFRSLIAADGPLEGTPLEEIVHPDFAEAGMQRRHLVIDLGAPVENSSVKLLGRDNSILYVMIDAMRAVFEDRPYMVTVARHATRL